MKNTVILNIIVRAIRIRRIFGNVKNAAQELKNNKSIYEKSIDQGISWPTDFFVRLYE